MHATRLKLAFLAAVVLSSRGFVIVNTKATTRSKQIIKYPTYSSAAAAASKKNNEDEKGSSSVVVESPAPVFVTSHPVLSQVYPALLDHKDTYGHPNIPLGSKEGKQCETLRRLHIQGKLSLEQVELLTNLGFRWHSLEDVYETCEFDKLFDRLVDYRKAEGNISPPKKYPADPELGAWVTGIRRLGRDKVLPAHAERLNAIGFEWTSPRQCGSAFMEQYRQIQSRIAEGEKESVWTASSKVQRWIKAQQEACTKGALSETRKHYMETILGENWKEWKPLE
ncbi:hypothetical protein MPSEU_000412300 [Mayamaea pseudoterrestris]|nr:hypothetical protein MPSEU_000412300 [Mayamaea pseudoterrestris]